jgi:HKD family nuclease
LANELARCCADYASLQIAVAWCGDPSKTLPFRYLEAFKGTIDATLGVSFNHTHPDAIRWFTGMGAAIRIFRKECGLFHPKVYLFTDGDRYTLFLGSSNLTYSGFYQNLEVNVLIDGTLSSQSADDVSDLKERLNEWHSDAFSFQPDDHWLKGYSKDYQRDLAKAREHGLDTPPLREERTGSASWLENADWTTYYDMVVERLKRSGRDLSGFHNDLDAAARLLPLPWVPSYFRDREVRRIIYGNKPYLWFGHVGAAGGFLRLIKNGSENEWATIVAAVNRIAALNPPIDWMELESSLRKLVQLKPTMKVWGRVLCLVRPDLYCTVSSPSVRDELAKTLRVAKASFERPEGYVKLIKLLHSSPWFNASMPQDSTEASAWARRVALMDAIFYQHPKAQI